MEKPITQTVFNRALEAVSRHRYAGTIKRTSALSRFRPGGSSLKKAHFEIGVDGGGYCAIKVYKTIDDVVPTGELRFVGSKIQATATTDLPFEVPGSQTTLALCIFGADLRREDGRLAGEVFIFAKDQRELTQISHAINALAKSSRPDGSCIFYNANGKSMPLIASSSRTIGIIGKSHLQTVSRACNRITSLKAVPMGLLNELAHFADKAEALEMLNSPEIELVDPGVVAKALLCSLESLPCRPVRQAEFERFSHQIEAVSLDMDAQIVCVALETLLMNLANLQVLKIVQEVTRAVKHIVYTLKSNSFRQVADEIGPLLIELDMNESLSNAMVAFLAACCSTKHRDRVFLAATSHFDGGSSVNELDPVVTVAANSAVLTVSSSTSDLPSSSVLAPLPAPITAAASVSEKQEINDMTSEDIASLTRLHYWLTSRLKDDPSHPNADLWKQELDACTAEMALLGPTMLLASSDATKVQTTTGIRRKKKEEDDDGRKNDDQPNILMDSVLTMWALIRNQDNIVVLNETLDKVQTLALNVQESDVPDAKNRAMSLALVGLLEENLRLRLSLAMVPPNSGGGDDNGREAELNGNMHESIVREDDEEFEI